MLARTFDLATGIAFGTLRAGFETSSSTATASFYDWRYEEDVEVWPDPVDDARRRTSSRSPRTR